MRQMVDNGEVDALVAERVWAETERALAEDRPSRFFEVLRGCGALAPIFPEIDALFGVPQPEAPHPERDTGVHALLVLDAAAALTTDPRVRFAALVHDLGKAATPEDEWPHHIEHEQRGVEIVESLCRRLRTPNDYRDLAVLVCRYHGQCHRLDELRPATVVRLLESIDAFRKPERLEQFALACEADARGRTSREGGPYPQGERLRRAYAAANAVDTRDIGTSGLKGEAARNEIHRRRVEAIRKALG
jgi:tRNA nucleotidyltransferase (CCA-adding enzyme)